ncbi:MAG: sigma-54-dependent Fis family transcriptional regulator [Myxococcales bacterium]|nr:sigma-54-dependent Fis family transcriptional regulator [Myxococcales bacterium]
MVERMEHRPATCETCGLVPVIERLTGATEMIAESAAMQAVLRRVARFAASDAPVAVFGETGTGKEVIARVLHASSERASGPFVPVNVAALPAELLESELFGHGKGAFTGATSARQGLFEAASKGTLFLDEVAELPLSLQAKLLRALQDGEIRRVGENHAFASDVRIVCATHRELADRVRDGSFRQDLFYRLKVLSVRVPPLRERRTDILPLAQRLLADERTSARDFSETAKAALLAYDWPGNVRELQNAVKHGAALATGRLVEAGDLPEEMLSIRPRRPVALRPLAEVERDHILAVLDACGGSQAEAARMLGIARNTLWRKLRSFDGRAGTADAST